MWRAYVPATVLPSLAQMFFRGTREEECTGRTATSARVEIRERARMIEYNGRNPWSGVESKEIGKRRRKSLLLSATLSRGVNNKLETNSHVPWSIYHFRH